MSFKRFLKLAILEFSNMQYLFKAGNAFSLIVDSCDFALSTAKLERDRKKRSYEPGTKVILAVRLLFDSSFKHMLKLFKRLSLIS